MIKSCQRFLFLLITLFASVFMYAQTSDAGAIGSVDISTDIGPLMSANVSQEIRFNQNLTSFDRSMTSLGLDYSLIRKVLKAELGYDFIYQNQINLYEFRHRASFALAAQYKLDSYSFQLKTKAQSTWRDESRGDYKFNPKYVWRNKLECTYTIFGSPVKPFVSGEVFCPLNGGNGFYMNGYRAIMGAKYRTSAHTTLEFMIRYDQDIQQSNPKSIVYGGFGWNYTL